MRIKVFLLLCVVSALNASETVFWNHETETKELSSLLRTFAKSTLKFICNFLTPKEVFELANTQKENFIRVLGIFKYNFIKIESASFLSEEAAKKLKNIFYRYFPQQKLVMVADPKFINDAADCWLVSADFIVPITSSTAPKQCRCCNVQFSNLLKGEIKYFHHHESISFILFGDQFFALFSLAENKSKSATNLTFCRRVHSIGDDLQVLEDFENEILFCISRHQGLRELEEMPFHLINMYDTSGKRKRLNNCVRFRGPRNMKTIDTMEKLNDKNFKQKLLKNLVY
jgi:hypothetical protein